jgi:regulatory protein
LGAFLPHARQKPRFPLQFALRAHFRFNRLRGAVRAMPDAVEYSAGISYGMNRMKIKRVECLFDGRVKLHTDSGQSFLFRARYLDCIDIDSLHEDDALAAGIFEHLLAASYAYLAEQKAMLLLNRSEQCRFLLSQKLRKKNFDDLACAKALDYLEETGLLDDSRYARAWLNERSGKKSEGRKRLEAELSKRGISHNVIQNALDSFFALHDEDEACRAAYEKSLRLKKPPEQIRAYLQRQGFTFAQIKRVLTPSHLAAGLLRTTRQKSVPSRKLSAAQDSAERQ